MKYFDEHGRERTWMSLCPECGRIGLVEIAIAGTGIGAVDDGHGGFSLECFSEPIEYHYLECLWCAEAVAFPQTPGGTLTVGQPQSPAKLTG